MKLLDNEHKIYLLEEDNFDFPSLEMMEDDLVAIGGDFHPERILQAYHNGIFPWFIDEYNHIHWYSPNKRMILFPEEFKISKSLKRVIKNKGFVIKSNTQFKEVMIQCAKVKRKHEDETWIDENFIWAYNNLYEMGYAFSIECYLDDELVGGLYGLLINNVFCGESMFSLVPNASKVAFYHLCQQAKENGIRFIDCQVYNGHLASLGAKEIPRVDYFNLLKNSTV